MYDLEAWRTSSPSFRDQLFHWTRLNSEDKLYSLGSQPPFNLVVRPFPGSIIGVKAYTRFLTQF